MSRQREPRDGGVSPSAPRRVRGQASFEYAVLLGVVAVAMVGMYFYSKRAIQGGLKTAADQLSPFADDTDGEQAQLAGMRYETGERSDQVFAAGTVLARISGVQELVNQPTNIQHQPGGAVVVSYQGGTTDYAGTLGAALATIRKWSST